MKKSLTLLFFFIFFFTSKTFSSSYEIDIDVAGSIPVLEAKINNKTYRLLFDSGAAATLILNETFLKEISEKRKTGKIRKSIDAKGQVNSAEEYIIPEVRLGSVDFKNIKTLPYHPRGLNASLNNETKDKKICEKIQGDHDGVLGIETFKDKKLIIDYARSKLIVFDDTPSKPYDTVKWKKVDYTPSPDGLIIKGTINSKAATFVLDTGATASVIHPNFSGSQNQKMTIDLKFGQYHLEKQIFYSISFEEPKVDAYLGRNFFFETIVYVDFKERNLYFGQI